MSTVNTSDEKTVFLTDEPCHDQSAFQIHEEIAKAIAHEIILGNPDNIALVGNWGSGKSTIVDRVEELLSPMSAQKEEKKSLTDSDSSSQLKQFVYFKFDTWAHSGDSLRKNFLTQLALKLESKGAISQSKKEEVENTVHGRISISSIKEDASFAPFVSAAIVSAALFALFSLVSHNISPFGDAITSNSYSSFIPWIDFCTLVLSIFFFGLMAFWLRRRKDLTLFERLKLRVLRLKEKTKKSQGAEKNELSNEVEESDVSSKDPRTYRFAKYLTNIFSKNADTTTITTRNDAPILDSLVFEEQFRELIVSSKKPIVIVFDNMDRLDKDDLCDAWKTLQIFANYFIQNKSIAQNGCQRQAFRRPWILLPISGHAFRLIDEQGGDPSGLSISKLFIRVFEIPTPITTDWRGYFLSQAQIAFPQCSQNELHSIYTVASHALLRFEGRTPRNAKRFINLMVSQSRVYPSIDLVSIAVFCFIKDSYLLIQQSNEDSKPDHELGNETFVEYVSKVIAHTSPISPYVESFSGYSDNLYGDLAMMSYGQFDYKAATEVFVTLEMQSLFNGNSTPDIYNLVSENQGSWSLIIKEVENEFAASSLGETPRWVFAVLQSLYSSKSAHYEENNVERDHLASLLISNVSTFPAQFKGCGNAIAGFVLKISENAARHIVDVACSAISEQLSNVVRSSDDETTLTKARNKLNELLMEIAPIFEKAYESDSSVKAHLQKGLSSVCFDDMYGECCKTCSVLSGSFDWVACRPPMNAVEFSTLVSVVEAKVFREILMIRLCRF